MDPLIIPVVAILMPLVLVPTTLILRHRHARREWEHRERMKALEMGYSVAAAPQPGMAKAVAAIGSGVPMVSVVMAAVATSEGPAEVDGVPLAAIIWSAAALISAGALGTSLVLAFLAGRRQSPTAVSSGSYAGTKPAYDPDAFDVVGSRA